MDESPVREGAVVPRGELLDGVMDLLRCEGLLITKKGVDETHRRYAVLLRNTLGTALCEGRLVVRLDGDTVIAVSHWTRPDETGTSEWLGILTRSTHRGSGQATLLMHDVLEACRTSGVRKLSAYSSASDHVTASMFEFFGFKPISEHKRGEEIVLCWERHAAIPFDKTPSDCAYSQGEVLDEL